MNRRVGLPALVIVTVVCLVAFWLMRPVSSTKRPAELRPVVSQPRQATASVPSGAPAVEAPSGDRQVFGEQLGNLSSACDLGFAHHCEGDSCVAVIHMPDMKTLSGQIEAAIISPTYMLGGRQFFLGTGNYVFEVNVPSDFGRACSDQWSQWAFVSVGVDDGEIWCGAPSMTLPYWLACTAALGDMGVTVGDAD